MHDSTEEQREAFERIFAAEASRWSFHDTTDPFIRYLRDRRLHLVIQNLRKMIGGPLESMSVLVVCGGVGGEASFFLNQGFMDVTNTDFSSNALEMCHRRDPRLKTLKVNAEAVALPDESYDLVIVQDGLHHLPRPALGLNEMIRVARRGLAVLEPHTGLVAKAIGTEWERHGDAVNFVFRWNHEMFRQVILSQCLERPLNIRALRLWDHNSLIKKIVSPLGGGKLSLLAAKLLYGLLAPINRLGNNFIGLMVKKSNN
jgi:ubiquinone/menaquinone biosynthesis C-methylase UbiE